MRIAVLNVPGLSGHSTWRRVEIPDALRPRAHALKACGCWLRAEPMTSGGCAVGIECNEFTVAACEVGANGLSAAVVALVAGFDRADFLRRLAEVRGLDKRVRPWGAAASSVSGGL